MKEHNDEYKIRRLTSEDAAAVSALAQELAGTHKAALSNPQEILDLNEKGSLIAVVALDNAQQVMGYYALTRPDAGRIADICAPVVIREQADSGLVERMRELLEREALGSGLLGLSNQIAVDDVMLQAFYERSDYRPTSVLFTGSSSKVSEKHRGFHIASVLNFKYLVPPPRVQVNAPDHHRPIIERIYQGLGRDIVSGTESAIRPGRLDSTYFPGTRRGLIQVREAGYRSADEAAEIRDSWCSSGATAVCVELPLNQPQTTAICPALEKRGFAFTGIRPGEGLDLLMMQFLTAPAEVLTVKMEGTLAAEILNYATAEIRRVNQPQQSSD
jgi:hypothetical protein